MTVFRVVLTPTIRGARGALHAVIAWAYRIPRCWQTSTGSSWSGVHLGYPRFMNRRQFLCLAAAALGPSAWAWRGAQAPRKFAGESVFASLLEKADELHWDRLPIGQIVGEAALRLLGTPYVGHTLEISDTVETCVVNLDGLDCVTYFETCLGFARMLRKGRRTPADLVAEVTNTRYRGGRLDGYVSRLHYTSEWIADNDRRGNVANLSASLPGAARFEKQIHFMSTHPKSYRQLRANPALVSAIAQIEKRLTASEMWHVPREKVAAIEPRLQTGDIVGITTAIAGIDCSHTGLCLRDQAGDLRFLHASSSAKKVVLDTRLDEYVVQNPKNLGVMIARPLEPR
jgi:hypothetical protein